MRKSFSGLELRTIPHPQRHRRSESALMDSRTTVPRPPASTAPIRQHTTLPLMHDFSHVYGIRGKKVSDEYQPGLYPWKNASNLKSLSWMKYVKLGPLPRFVLSDPEDVMTNEKREFFKYLTTNDKTVSKANAAQISKDVRRNTFLKVTVPRMLELVFVEDRNWSGRFPLYVQGMDRLVNDWSVKINVKATVTTLRYYIIAMEYVYRDTREFNSLVYLGRSTPFETIHSQNELLPLFDKIKYISELYDQPHFAYDVAVQLKNFYSKQKSSSLVKNLRSFLKTPALSPMVDGPDLMVTFRHAEDPVEAGVGRSWRNVW